MKINDKLNLSQRKNRVSFISEGVFSRVYNQSAYIVTELLDYELKLFTKSVKKLNHTLFVYASFPTLVLLDRFPQADKTLWGYQLAGQFDLSGYASWYAQATSAYVVQASQEASTTCAHLLLNKKQSAYLDSWQKDKYPIETNLAFIESLKKRLN